MRVIVLGSHSFFTPGVKVGIQHIAEGLAERGIQVDYISSGSSPLDLLEKQRRSRFRRVWIDRIDNTGRKVTGNLTEYAFRTFFPVNNKILRYQWQIKLYPMLRPIFLKETEYDLCIHDTSATYLFLPEITAKKYIFRLNDLPQGFSYHVHENVINELTKRISDGFYSEIWAVSKPLADYAKTLNDKMRVVTIPNGVNLNSLIDHSKFRDTDYEEKTAVFVGAIEEWVDTELIDRTARLLKNWRFDIYGPKSKRWDIQSENVHYCGVIPKNQVSSKLLNYEVGLIPFRKHDLIKVMERPLKFYEYLAANLGIASTDVGYLREGMGNWVEFGNTPEEFAAAIELASQKRKQRTTREIYLYLQEYSWEKIIDQIIERL